MELYRSAAAKGHAEALTRLGYCYLHGYFVALDRLRAAELFRCAMAMGSTTGEVENNLGWYYEFEADLSQARRYYRLALEKGHQQAKDNLIRLGGA